MTRGWSAGAQAHRTATSAAQHRRRWGGRITHVHVVAQVSAEGQHQRRLAAAQTRHTQDTGRHTVRWRARGGPCAAQARRWLDARRGAGEAPPHGAADADGEGALVPVALGLVERWFALVELARVVHVLVRVPVPVARAARSRRGGVSARALAGIAGKTRSPRAHRAPRGVRGRGAPVVRMAVPAPAVRVPLPSPVPSVRHPSGTFGVRVWKGFCERCSRGSSDLLWRRIDGAVRATNEFC